VGVPVAVRTTRPTWSRPQPRSTDQPLVSRFPPLGPLWKRKLETPPPAVENFQASFLLDLQCFRPSSGWKKPVSNDPPPHSNGTQYRTPLNAGKVAAVPPSPLSSTGLLPNEWVIFESFLRRVCQSLGASVVSSLSKSLFSSGKRGDSTQKAGKSAIFQLN
jgi:hypothetical protein